MEPTATGTRSHTQLAALIGAGAIIIGSMLPWATARSVFGSMSMSGIEGDGVITLVLGAGLALAAWLRPGRRGWQAATLTGAGLVLAVGILDAVIIGGVVGDQYATASIGAGLYIVLIGAALTGGATIAAMRSSS